MEKRRIAIIGTGISGLGCAHYLKDHFDLTLFEKDNRIGGHSNTVYAKENGREVPIDTGFMVYNEVTYPLLTKLFTELNVETKATSMSFSVQHVNDNLEFNGGSLNLLFGQRRNLLRPRFWKMLLQIDRFNKETVAELKEPQFGEMTLAEYVTERGYGEDFLKWYLSPMAAAVWSSPPENIEKFPAHTLMRFWHNHGFLGLDTQHPWRTVEGGSQEYVKKISAPFENRIRKNSRIKEVTTSNEIVHEDGTREAFDLVIFASHADQSLTLLSQPTSLESELLKNFTYQDNLAVLHTDDSCMPKTKRCRASWNYRISSEGKHSTVYWMNSLQGVSKKNDYFVSINPDTQIAESKMIKQLDYEHPIFDLAAIQAQERLPELHKAGKESGRFFCGAWQRYGFHEDGLWSAHRLCESLLGEDFRS